MLGEMINTRVNYKMIHNDIEKISWLFKTMNRKKNSNLNVGNKDKACQGLYYLYR